MKLPMNVVAEHQDHLETGNMAKFVWGADKRDANLKPIPTTDHALLAEMSQNGSMDSLKSQSKPHPESIAIMLDDLLPGSRPLALHC